MRHTDLDGAVVDDGGAEGQTGHRQRGRRHIVADDIVLVELVVERQVAVNEQGAEPGVVTEPIAADHQPLAALRPWILQPQDRLGPALPVMTGKESKLDNKNHGQYRPRSGWFADPTGN